MIIKKFQENLFLSWHNFEDTFPRTDSPDFRKRAYDEYQALTQRKKWGHNCTASRLRNQLEKKRGKINNDTAIILWLYFCVERPWEKDWKIAHNEDLWEKIYYLLPEDSNPRTWKRYVKREDVKRTVYRLANSFDAFEQIMTRLSDTISKISFIHLIKSDFGHAYKILMHIKENEVVSLRQLYKKFSISKSRCEYLLDFIQKEDKDLIEIIEGISDRRTIYIHYIGP